MVRALSGFLALLVLAGAQSAHAQNWQLTDGAARDVGVGADGSVWVIGTNAVGGGYGIYRRRNNTWVNVPGGAERIAVDPRGNAWVVNNTNTIFRFDGSQWVTVPGQTARDIGIGANGTVWVIGTVAEAGGYAIHRSTDQGASWVKVPGSAVRVSVDPQGNAWVVNKNNNIFRFDGNNWAQLTGAATDIGIGADGAAWVIGTDNGIYRWENNNWSKKPGGAAQIAAGPHGAVWVVNQGNQIYQANAPLAPGLAVAAAVASPTAPVSAAAPAPAPAPTTLTATTIDIPPPAAPTAGTVTVPTATVIPTPTITITQPPATTTPVVIPTPNLNISPPATAPSGPVSWVRTDGAARDVAVGANGAVWVIGTNAVPGGYGIYRRTNNTWVNVPGGAERIAVDPRGNAWVVNNSNTIFRHDGSQWVTVAGQSARDIGIGANGTVWVIGTNVEAGGFGIYRSTDQGASWAKIPGSAVRVSVDPQGNAWVVNNANAIFRFDGSTWVTQPGTATDVGIGADGSAWVIGADTAIYRFEGSNWANKTGNAAQIAAGPAGTAWVVQRGGEIYQAQTAAVAQAGTTPLNIPEGTIVLQGVTSIPVTGTIGSTGSTVAVPGSGGLVVGSPTLPGTTQTPITVTGSIDTSNMIGPVGTSQATCGVPGKPLCSPSPALLVGNADVTCPSGSFPDLGRSACYSCPEGYTRSIHAVDNYKACQKPDASITGGFQAATFQAPLCASGSFYDPIRGGECYSCPAGYNRSAAHIDASNACYIPIHEVFSSATKHKTTIWPHECSSGTFWDGYNGGACYSCPSGYGRTAHHIANNNACAKWVGESQARATLVKKAECGPGEIRDMYVAGTQNPAYGGGCWTCPIGTDRSIHPIYGQSACERAPGVQWASATRVRGMTCEPHEIYDPIASGNSAVAEALRLRNAADPSSPVTAKTIGGTCWTCPANYKRSSGAVYAGTACTPPDIVWAAAPYNQPGLFGLRGAEAVALRLVNERTLLNTLIRDIQAAGNAPANFAQVTWDQIATRPQDSPILALAVFSRVVAASTTPASATPDELALLQDVKEHIRKHRVYMAQNALDAYRAWKSGETYRTQNYAQSQLMVMTNIGKVPPDFELITAESIMGGLGAAVAANTAIYMTMSSAAVYKSLFPFAVREITKQIVAQATQAGITMTKFGIATATKAASAAAGAAMSAGPQVIVTIGLIVLQAAIEQQIAIAEAEPKLLTGLATAQNFDADFKRLMATSEGTSQAQGYWSMLLSGPAPRADGSRPAAVGPQNLQAFAQGAAVAKQALVAGN